MWRKWTLAVPLVLVGSVLTAVPAVAEGIAWQRCGAADCGEVRVPLDWSRPGGAKITVAVSRLPATDPARRIGVLVINPGGPGGPGRALLRDHGTELFPADLRARFDIIGLDPRGVGESRPAIACPVPPNGPGVTQFPTTRAEYDRLIAYNRSVAASCRTATGPLIDHVDTVSAARDIDVVRAALGEQKISWLGLSYGSMLGATYAGMYPNRVRAAVLDGAVDHTIGSRRMAVDEARATEDVFGAFARWCATDTSCALHGRDVAAEYRALLDSGADGLTAEQIGYSAYGLLSLTDYWPDLATAIRDRTGFEEGGSAPAYRVIACHDFPSDIRSFADMTARLAEIRAVAPNTRGHVEGWDVQAGCLGWPIPAKNPWGPTPVRGAPPILVVSGEHDPATPHSWGIGLACQISGSRLLTWTGVGHTAYFNDTTTRQREIDYLLRP
ncbi:pimeloyl-ACP methyl ester carboxylesterase [Actinokineospora baliensis]|uniref:alpha/beta hydrolase n=1 Tax=Actinokineospora baliensis TaxID=547056 RepID=UPI00195A12AF|nr:alpha/beta hydrolase [Actinokineospora baliensis]MBM7775569.1 pimeloyl-ACP methyl ester carboxylesterase [Actinokineospora baliensis]